jgi:hypothetical protein
MLLRRHVHARGNERAIGSDRAATGRRSLGRNDRCVASRPAIRRQKHLVGIALDRAIRRVARRSNDPDADVRTGRPWIAFGARRSGRARIAFRPLISTAAQHCGSECDGDERPRDGHGAAASRLTPTALTTCHLVAQRKSSCRKGSTEYASPRAAGTLKQRLLGKIPFCP